MVKLWDQVNILKKMGAIFAVFISAVHPIGLTLAVLGGVVWVKMMYWDLVLRLDKELK